LNSVVDRVVLDNSILCGHNRFSSGQLNESTEKVIWNLLAHNGGKTALMLCYCCLSIGEKPSWCLLKDLTCVNSTQWPLNMNGGSGLSLYIQPMFQVQS